MRALHFRLQLDKTLRRVLQSVGFESPFACAVLHLVEMRSKNASQLQTAVKETSFPLVHCDMQKSLRKLLLILLKVVEMLYPNLYQLAKNP